MADARPNSEPDVSVLNGCRVKFLDYDARPNPKTDLYCCCCQRDLKPNKPYRFVHLVGDSYLTLHPDDESKYVSDRGDWGFLPIGNDCAKRHGLEWTHAEVPAAKMAMK